MRPCPPTAARTVEVDTTAARRRRPRRRAAARPTSPAARAALPKPRIEVDNSPPDDRLHRRRPGRGGGDGERPLLGRGLGDDLDPPRRRRKRGPTCRPNSTPGATGPATLTAPLPELGAGTYFFRAAASGRGGERRLGPAPGRPAAPPKCGEQAARPGARAQVGDEAGTAGGKGGGAGKGRRRRRAPRLGPRDPPDVRPAPRRRPSGTAAPLRRVPWRLGIVSAVARSRRLGRVVALTVDYGTAVEVRGRLTDARGGGIDGRPVAVVVRGAAGVGGAPERRRVVTDRGGRFGAAASQPGPRAASPSPSTAAAGSRPRPGARSRCGSAPRSASRPSRPSSTPANRSASTAASSSARRGSPAAASSSRSSTSSGRPAAGAPRSSSAPTPRATSTRNTASATSPASPRFACARRRRPKAAGPSPGAPPHRSRSTVHGR